MPLESVDKLIISTLLKRPFTGAFFLVFFAQSNAAVYQSTDSEGGQIFSDQSSNGAEVFVIPHTNSINIDLGDKQKSIPSPLLSKDKLRDDFFEVYREFQLISPTQNETIRNNAGLLTIKLTFTPKLKKYHVIKILLDDQLLAKSWTQKEFIISNIHRGTHSISARLVDMQSGNTLNSTSSSIFHFKQFSKNF